MISRTTILKTFSLAALLLFFGVAGAQAQALKIGYSAGEEFLQFMPQAQQVQQQLQQEGQATQERLQTQLTTFQEEVDRYQKQQALLSEETRQQREQKLAQMQRDLQQADVAAQQQIAQREQELLQPLLQRIEVAIADVAKEKGLDLVMRGPAILYVNEAKIVDISMDVARKLGIEVSEDQLSDSAPSN